MRNFKTTILPEHLLRLVWGRVFVCGDYSWWAEVVLVLLLLPGEESSSVETTTGGQEVVFALRDNY